jgi:hypothetical protein
MKTYVLEIFGSEKKFVNNVVQKIETKVVPLHAMKADGRV